MENLEFLDPRSERPNGAKGGTAEAEERERERERERKKERKTEMKKENNERCMRLV